MHYVRFLKTPRVAVQNGTTSVNAVITVTTDLGETFYPHDLVLAVSLRAPEHDGDIFLRRTVQWSEGMRSLPVQFDLTRNEVDWPAVLHIGLRTTATMCDDFDSHLPAVISISSESLNPLKGSFETRKRVERRFTPLSGRTLTIFEDTGDSIARHLWDGSITLTAYIDRVIALRSVHAFPLLENVLASAAYRKLNVLELGCGCGVVGIGLAQTIPDCDVLLTDLAEVDELVERNIEGAIPAMSSNIEFTPLDWEAPLPDKVKSRTFDLILVAECIYNSDSIPPLVDTLYNLILRSPKAIILLSTKIRHDSEAMFWDLFQKRGFVQSAKTSLPLPGEPGQGYGDSASEVDLYVYHGPSHRQSRSPSAIE